jgi:uncharacterized membrane protein SirB2
MTSKQKVFFFCLAVCVMACMAISAIFIGQSDYLKSVLFLVIGFLLVGVGFMSRKRILRELAQKEHTRI